jgi:hypothetical protein
MQRPTDIEKMVDPISKNIGEYAKRIVNSDRHIGVIVTLASENLSPEVRAKVVNQISTYGIITRNEPNSQYVVIEPFKVTDFKRLEDDFYDDKLPDVVRLSLNLALGSYPEY